MCSIFFTAYNITGTMYVCICEPHLFSPIANEIFVFINCVLGDFMKSSWQANLYGSNICSLELIHRVCIILMYGGIFECIPDFLLLYYLK